MSYVRHMRDAWGVSVWFDSGGFFVQQGKIRYEELFTRLLHFYRGQNQGVRNRFHAQRA